MFMAKDESSKGKRKQDTPPPINQPICEDIQDALMGQQINFTGVVGSCTLSIGNTTWPFNWGPNIPIPNPGNRVILIAQGLNITPPNNVYQYVVSCCPQATQTKTVKVTG
jgi:hypothetical protein